MSKILLVEDNEMNREGLSRLLVKRGFQVIVAEDGLRAIQLAQESSPDIIIMDVEIPGIDGYEAIKNIRSYEQERGLPQVPILVLTAHALLSDKLTAEEAGCTAFECKPVKFKSLLERVKNLLGSGE